MAETTNPRRRMVDLAAIVAVGLACARTTDIERADRSATPSPPPSRRSPDVPYEPSPQHVVTEIVRLSRLVSGDVLYDLGCGDGRIVIAAVRTPGVRGVCVDIDPERIAESRENAGRAGVGDRIEFRNEDLFETDIRDASVVTLFLWPKINVKLRPKLLRDLAPGARVVSYMHDMDDWEPHETVPVHSGKRPTHIYLWVIPQHSG
jgi:SAM-dependent methyltransferase